MREARDGRLRAVEMVVELAGRCLDGDDEVQEGESLSWLLVALGGLGNFGARAFTPEIPRFS